MPICLVPIVRNALAPISSNRLLALLVVSANNMLQVGEFLSQPCCVGGVFLSRSHRKHDFFFAGLVGL